MAYEFVTILLGACFAALAVLYVALWDYLGHLRKMISSAVPTPVVKTYAPTVEPVVEAPAEVELPAEEAPAGEAPVTSEPAPTFAPPLYETVQPTPAPAPLSYPTASVASFGTTIGVKKPTWTYRRRPAPIRSTSASKAPHSKSKKR